MNCLQFASKTKITWLFAFVRTYLLVWIGIFFATFMHLMHSTCTIVCITHAYHAFRTFFWKILHQSWVIKYRKYCVIIVSKPKVSINIVWTLKKIAKWKLKQIWLNLETNNKRVPVRLRIKKNISLRKHNLKGHCLVSRDSVKLCPDLLVFLQKSSLLNVQRADLL